MLFEIFCFSPSYGAQKPIPDLGVANNNLFRDTYGEIEYSRWQLLRPIPVIDAQFLRHLDCTTPRLPVDA